MRTDVMLGLTREETLETLEVWFSGFISSYDGRL